MRVAIFADGCFMIILARNMDIRPKREIQPVSKTGTQCQARLRKSSEAQVDGAYRAWRFWEHSLKKSDLCKVEKVLSRRIERLAADRKRERH